MRLLLDTHVIIWMISDDRRISQKARKTIDAASSVYWSVASLWEMGIKQCLNRKDFQLGPNWAEEIPRELLSNGFERMNIEPAHCGAISHLRLFHGDPFDRMLVCQAIHRDLTLVTADSKIAGYPVKTLW
jgi:PIN domain nuclease of toxin-antitoxin system